uniref:Uncharacterized protein n=1 Tax=Oryza meridionalis TaxID=40149 RepID=A0A0E0CFE0_9ORYZ
MDVGPSCACVIIVKRFVSEPAGQAALCHCHRTPHLRANGPGCACVVVIHSPGEVPGHRPCASCHPTHRRVTVPNPRRRRHRSPSPVSLVLPGFALGSPVADSPQRSPSWARRRPWRRSSLAADSLDNGSEGATSAGGDDEERTGRGGCWRRSSER